MATEEKQSTARRDQLHQIELEVQKKWEDAKVFEMDAPAEKVDKFFATFPYPYMNGVLHIGHAFSLTKAIFATQFNRLLGKKALFPFGFHCTGMPIQAAANKLKREYAKYGSTIPTFPAGRPSIAEKAGLPEIEDNCVTLRWKPPASTGKKDIKVHNVFVRVGKGGEFKKVVSIPHPSPAELKDNEGKVVGKAPVEDGGCTYKIITELVDGSSCPDSNESEEVFVDAAPKTKAAAATGGKRVAKKILAKTGDAAFQWEILFKSGIKPEDMPPFADALYWLNYFPGIGKTDLIRFGAPIDFRRSFITTDVNPYYDSFVRWHFSKLKKSEKVGFGKRPTIYSPVDGQACMDHERVEGEGVAPQEYTAIKIELLEFPPVMKPLEGKRVFLLAATLRAETMPGQTNCWILPEGEYGCFKHGDDEVYVSSHRAANNMSFQEILTPWGKPECLMNVMGQDLMGAKVRAPTSSYESVHLLPLLTIKMDKGTGIVTSVPSDSPDDYAALMDLMKPGKREHFGIKAEWVEPFKLIPIIDVEIDGEVRHMAAQYMCEKLGIQSQKDKEKLLEAHDTVYKLGFDKGIMSSGPFKGQPVKKAKLEFRAQMVNDGQAFVYSEPEKKVVGRSNDECVVAGIDQWYLKYGEESWRKQIEDHINGENFCSYNDRIKDSFLDAIGWLKEWACSRSFGLGTRVPWDEQFVIESLSDSTIYMAYYTVAHFLQSDLNGTAKGCGNIEPKDLTNEVWDFVFLDGPLPKDCKIPRETMEKMRHEFRFWYPVDVRVSGKDLIQNHLTMSLYNHACVWEDQPDKWPRSFFCNGWLLVNNEKMSKAKGNFFSLNEILSKYSADAARLAMADAGDTLEPANYSESVANKNLLAMSTFLESMKALISGTEPTDDRKEDVKFVDRWFANEMNRLVTESRTHYEAMFYQRALRTAYYEFTGAFKKYGDICKALQMKLSKNLVMKYLEWQLIILSPICPHICEHGWGLLGKPGTILDARFPVPASEIDLSLIRQGDYIYDKVPHSFIKLLEKASKKGTPASAVVYVAQTFADWKIHVLGILRRKHAEGKLPLVTQDTMDDDSKARWKDIMMELMKDPALKSVAKHVGPFAAFKRDEAATVGITALDDKVPFDELALLKENTLYLADKLKLGLETMYMTELKDASHQESASLAQPGAPSVHYCLPAGGDAGGGKKASDGGKAPAAKDGGKAKGGGKATASDNGKAKAKEGAKSGAAKPPAAGVITDMKKLNEHFSTRSYFEGGAGPTPADAAQFAATPTNVNAEEFPHVKRWYRHIAFFTPAQQARWSEQ